MRFDVGVFQLQSCVAVDFALLQVPEQLPTPSAVGKEFRYSGVQSLGEGYYGLGVESDSFGVVLLLEGCVACFFELLDSGHPTNGVW